VAQCTGHGPWSQAAVEVVEPAQSAPPLRRPSHVRVIDFVPAPQLVEQVPYVQPDQVPSTAHAWVLQFCDEVVEPAQSAPPLNGAGLSHARVIDCVPVPQLLEQVPYV
jgi:hypothetical protein